MNLEIVTEASQFPEKENINGILLAVWVLVYRFNLQARVCVLEQGAFGSTVQVLGPAMQGLGCTVHRTVEGLG